MKNLLFVGLFLMGFLGMAMEAELLEHRKRVNSVPIKQDVKAFQKYEEENPDLSELAKQLNSLNNPKKEIKTLPMNTPNNS